MGNKILGPTPKANVNSVVPSIGKDGRTGGGKSGGPNIPFLPAENSYSGRKGGGLSGTVSGSTEKSNRVPFIPSKPE